MEIKVAEIHFKNQKIEDYAVEKVSKLEKYHKGIKLITVRLTLEKNHRNQNHTSFCELEFDISGKNFVIKDSEREIDKAIDKAVERAKRTLIKRKEKTLSKNHKRGIVEKLFKRVRGS